MYKAEFPTAASLVDNSTFMDDFAAGAENDVRVTVILHTSKVKYLGPTERLSQETL